MKRKLGVVLVAALLLSLLALSAMPVKATTLEDGLVLYLPMDEGYGSTTADLSGYGNDGAIYGATWVSGKYGKALRFDGSDDYVAVSYASSLNPAKITVCAWVKLYQNITGEHHIVRIDNYGSYWFGVTINGKVFFGYREASGGIHDTVFSTDAITWGEWTFIFGGMSPEGESDAKRFVGFDDNYYEFSAWESRWIGSGVVGIGMWNNEFTQGVIDEVRVYNRALSPAEIRELYAYSPYQVPSTFNEKTALYAWNTLSTVNNVTGYGLNATAPIVETGANITVSTATSASATWGWRIYIRHASGATELTAGTPSATVTRSSNGSGLQTSTFTLTNGVNLQFGTSALELVLYQRWGTDDWVARAIFITDELFYPELVASTWTFQVYTEYSTSDTVTYATVRWGNSSYVTGVSNVIFTQPDQFDWMGYHLGNGDPFSFITAPFTYLVGNLFYAMIAFAVCGTYYLRYRNAGVLLVLLVLFGGAGGIANLFAGDVTLGIVWLLATFGLAALLYRTFR